jgi:uncharacterized protein YjbI with pentapeptide repeats
MHTAIDYRRLFYKPPEEIRKANLRCANRIGAKLKRTDFYLVDLRGIQCSKSQARHFAKSAAILKTTKD